MHPKIFVSYNPGVEMEQSTALRLQTIASLYGATVYLPDRLGGTSLKKETEERILDSHAFVLFATSGLSKTVMEEVRFALHNNKRVVIFHDSTTGKRIKISDAPEGQLVDVLFDPYKDTPAAILQKAFDQGGIVQNARLPENASSPNPALSAVIGIGLGLFMLWALNEDEPQKTRR